MTLGFAVLAFMQHVVVNHTLIWLHAVNVGDPEPIKCFFPNTFDDSYVTGFDMERVQLF